MWVGVINDINMCRLLKKLITIITSLIITGSIFITNSGIVYGQNKDMVVDTSQLEEFQESINHQFYIIKSSLQQNEQGQYYVDESWLEKYIADSSELSLTKNELNELVTLMNSTLSSRRRVRRNVCDLWGLSKEILWEFIEHFLKTLRLDKKSIKRIHILYETGSFADDNKELVYRG